MCGIAGIVRFDGGAAAQLGRARAMRGRLRHRGPDGEGELVDPYAVLQHTRLALLDREGGAQPMTTPDGRFSIVYNGEVYNHAELRAELRYPFRTRCDAETVLAAFAAWGPACVRRFNGMFAFFVWDHARRRGFLARDPLGVKPLAYAWDGVELVFASEAHAVAHSLRSRVGADVDAVLEYLIAPCFSGVARSMFAGVDYLQPGHTLEVAVDGVQIQRYFRFEVAQGGEAPAPEAVRAALQRAVGRACVAEAPIGVFLSGGLDSSAVAAFAAAALPDPPPAYTIAFDGMDAFDYAHSTIVVSDDSPFATRAAAASGLPLTRVQAPRAELAADLERIARHNDALPAWEQEVAQDRLARAAAGAVKAVLVGDAADETHFGYHFLLDAAATASPAAILRRFGQVPVRREVLADPLAAFTERYRAWMRPTDSPAARIAGTTSLIVERWLPRLLHNGDVHTMRAGLEARVPFADVELLALAAAVPPATGLAGGVEKARLRAALRGVLPEEIRLRRKSALPKDQGAAAVLQREASRLLADPPALVRMLVDLPALAPLTEPRRTLAEWERAALFRVVCLGHFGHHHGLA
ncbi:asparagine synthase (glutamine-hydrolysing) [Nannocystis exedens]|uniref:asparagine synthase (glutamine-hydrolyzing) n=1 Tax=Nannocystis exedens TaxID=54 RepID=A0A1I2IIT0_9BACT|nr:asparagine synthase (glutamine-hydrolyzing) [Nannocystis exedens]PCC73664.1 asparagine synthetase B [Nannocystis exedens]SFF40977.1 asparagine synthase (glutamine-hydrolysing) [Nannocystis exedens]